MKLIAKQPCSFGGKQFFIGDDIPAELVIDPKSQEKIGVISIAKDGDSGQDDGKIPAEWNFSLVVPRENGENMVLDFDIDGMTQALSALISKPEDAKAIIETMTGNDALIFLHMADGRKAIKAAAEARANAIAEAGEQ